MAEDVFFLLRDKCLDRATATLSSQAALAVCSRVVEALEPLAAEPSLYRAVETLRLVPCDLVTLEEESGAAELIANMKSPLDGAGLGGDGAGGIGGGGMGAVGSAPGSGGVPGGVTGAEAQQRAEDTDLAQQLVQAMDEEFEQVTRVHGSEHLPKFNNKPHSLQLASC